MVFNKTKNIITLALLLFAGTSFAYGMDEKPSYPPRAQQQEAEAPQAERARRPHGFTGFYGVKLTDECLLSETEKFDFLNKTAYFGNCEGELIRIGIQGIQGIEVPYYAAQYQHFIGSAQVVVPEQEVQSFGPPLSDQQRYELDID